MENLCILLIDTGTTGQSATLPTNADVLRIITSSSTVVTSEDPPAPPVIEINELYVTLWTESGKRVWYLGYCTSINGDKIIIDHMHRVRKNSNIMWKYPQVSDSVEVELDQILELRPEGEWDLSLSRSTVFKLKNGLALTQSINSQ